MPFLMICILHSDARDLLVGLLGIGDKGQTHLSVIVRLCFRWLVYLALGQNIESYIPMFLLCVVPGL